MRPGSVSIIALVIFLLIDVYAFQAFRVLMQDNAVRNKWIVYGIYWAISAALLAMFVFPPSDAFQHQNRTLYNVVLVIIMGVFLAKIMIITFLFIDDVRRGVALIIKAVSKSKPEALTGEIQQAGITRSAFLVNAGLLLGGGFLVTMLYGMRNRYRYHINVQNLKFASLPAAFKGFRVLQISDVHSGSFNDKVKVQHGIDMIMAQKPDIILFTGDIVNNLAEEMDDYLDVFARLSAPMGVYSVLGNHDYGLYARLSKEGRQANLERVKNIHQKLGWRLMMNENVILSRGQDQIALLGVENWSANPRFPKLGRLDLAYAGTEHVPFKMLMSHDPSHWDGEINQKYKDIQLTMSGHTHGMQFGIEIPGFKWSPVQYSYKQWAGLYNQDDQYLYVNRGFGFLGYPGRVGILPEITVFELS